MIKAPLLAPNEIQTQLLEIKTKSLKVACEVSGPADGAAVILIHGWPDSVRTWDRLLPALHDAGYRTFVPHLRGFGKTEFCHPTTPRRASLSTLGSDLSELIDGLNVGPAHLVGHDWGARAAYIASCLWPQQVLSCTALSVGWGTNDPEQTLTLSQAQNYWYHWYMATPLGERALRNGHREFTRFIWEIWNPGWPVCDNEFEDTACAFDNPDWIDVVLHSYRVRWGLAESDLDAIELDRRIQRDPTITVPTLVIHGGSDPCNEPSTSECKDRLFGSEYNRRLLPNVGHFPQRQAHQEVLEHLLPFLENGSK